MTTSKSQVFDELLISIRDGTFPDSEELLLTEVTPSITSSLETALARAKDELSQEIREISRDQTTNVDGWIEQAKKLQQDIVQCKQLVQEIRDEYAKNGELSGARHDAEAKHALLDGEIQFTAALKEELTATKSVDHRLVNIEQHVSVGSLSQSATELRELQDILAGRRPTRVKALLESQAQQLRDKCLERLQTELLRVIAVESTANLAFFAFKVNSANPQSQSTENLLKAFQDLDRLDIAELAVALRIEQTIVRPLVTSTSHRCTSIEVAKDSITLQLSDAQISPSMAIQHVQTLIQYLHEVLPEMLSDRVASRLLPPLLSKMYTTWLQEAIPLDVTDLPELDELAKHVYSLALLLESYGWPGHQPLLAWCDRVPQVWLERRKMAALQAIRNTLKQRRGPLKQIHHIEKHDIQSKSSHHGQAVHPNSTSVQDEVSEADDDTSGWDFEDEDEKPNTSANGIHEATADQDADEAWGWNDDDEKGQPHSRAEVNGGAPSTNHQSDGGDTQEITLVETLSITDVPDLVLKIVEHEMSDSHTLAESPHPVLNAISPRHESQNVTSEIFTIFRALAPSYYNNTFTAGNMQLYNDTTYMVRSYKEKASAGVNEIVHETSETLQKFARTTYARELDVQRTIIIDLLDGAQGFVNCTQMPNSTECENAIAGVIDRIKTVYETWKVVLSTSTLLQAVGGLLSAATSKMVSDVEDMDDISEPQSQRLSSLFGRLKDVEDMFVAPSLNFSALGFADADERRNMSQIALFSPGWLRFTYLIDILDSNLEEIKYYWTHGFLGIEYTQDEVIDLVKALFSDSSHRKNFISDIRRIEPRSQFE